MLVQKGQLAATISGKTTVAGPGSVIYIPLHGGARTEKRGPRIGAVLCARDRYAENLIVCQ